MFSAMQDRLREAFTELVSGASAKFVEIAPQLLFTLIVIVVVPADSAAFENLTNVPSITLASSPYVTALPSVKVTFSAPVTIAAVNFCVF